MSHCPMGSVETKRSELHLLIDRRLGQSAYLVCQSVVSLVQKFGARLAPQWTAGSATFAAMLPPRNTACEDMFTIVDGHAG